MSPDGQSTWPGKSKDIGLPPRQADYCYIAIDKMVKSA